MAAYGFGDSSFRAAGGEEGLRKLVESFYSHMNQLEEAKGIRAMHDEDLTDVKDRLARFLCGWLGGPPRYREKYGPVSIPMAHLPFSIGQAEHDAWLLCMQKAVDEQPYASDFKEYLMKQFRVPAGRVRNRP